MGVTFDEFDDIIVYFSCLLSHFIIEIWAIEGAFKLKCIGYSLILFDVYAHFISGSCSECDDGHRSYFIDDGT